MLKYREAWLIQWGFQSVPEELFALSQSADDKYYLRIRHYLFRLDEQCLDYSTTQVVSLV